MDKKFSILILTERVESPNFSSCLHALAHTSNDMSYEVLISRATPATFCYAHEINRLASIAEGEILVLLNDDCWIQTSWQETMLEDFRDPMVAMVGAKLLYSNGKIQHGGGELVKAGPGNVVEAAHKFLGESSTYPAANLPCECDFVTFAFAGIRKKVFDVLEGLDERYPMGHEDVDFGWRIHVNGYRCLYDPRLLATHAGMASSSSRKIMAKREKSAEVFVKLYGFSPTPYVALTNRLCHAQKSARNILKLVPPVYELTKTVKKALF